MRTTDIKRGADMIKKLIEIFSKPHEDTTALDAVRESLNALEGVHVYD